MCLEGGKEGEVKAERLVGLVDHRVGGSIKLVQNNRKQCCAAPTFASFTSTGVWSKKCLDQLLRLDDRWRTLLAKVSVLYYVDEG